MKKLALLVLAAVCLTGCWTSIRTVAPTTEVVVPVKTVYTTTVTTPSPKQTTYTTVTVTNYNEDMSFYLDLRAVAAAFAESRSVREFEQILNSTNYMINNLDLNRDGWIDYLRVIETHQGYYHALLIQACLAPSVFQDVATLVAERRADRLYVEVIGDRYLYGYNYIVRPVFINRPPLWSTYGAASYKPWVSPYYYGSFPGYYTKPKPIYLNHYQAYVNTYMSHHHYCHQCDYPTQPNYRDYAQMTQPHARQDYQTLHPDQSFERRVTTPMSRANASSTTVTNAGQLREVTEVKPTKTDTRTSQSSQTTRTPQTPQATRSQQATQTKEPARTTQETKTTTTRTTQTRQPTATETRQPSTSVETRVNKSGTTRTTVKTTDASGRTTSVKRESASRTSSTQQQRQSSSTQQQRQGSSTRSSQSTRGESSPRSSQRAR